MTIEDRNGDDPGLTRFLSALRRCPPTTDEEEQRLSDDLRSGGSAKEAAEQRLVESHMPLVVKVAAHFRGRGISLSDLVQEGALGLYDATRKFDRRIATFRTYAFSWVWQRLQDYVSKHSRNVRLPTSAVKKGLMIAQARQSGGLLSDAQIAEQLGIDVSMLRAIEGAMQSELSTDAPVNDGSDTIFGDTLPAPDEIQSLEDRIDLGRAVTIVRTAVGDNLTGREMEVLKRRFGIGGGSDGESVEGLKELAELFGVSRQRIQQIEVKARKKLKNGCDKARLREALATFQALS